MMMMMMKMQFPDDDDVATTTSAAAAAAAAEHKIVHGLPAGKKNMFVIVIFTVRVMTASKHTQKHTYTSKTPKHYTNTKT